MRTDICDMNNHRELELWKLAINITKDIYVLVKKFPVEEKFGLVDQIKRCTISISANVAEGCGRASNKEFIHFLSISYGSSAELDSLITASYEIGFITKDELDVITEKNIRIQKMNSSLRSAIQKRNNI